MEITYDIVADTVCATWKGEQTETSIMQGFEKILEAISDNLCRYLLDDHSEISGIWVGAAEWLARDWYPRAQKKGLKYMAVIYSRHTFSRRSTERALDLIAHKDVLGFDTKAAAEGWLADMQKMR